MARSKSLSGGSGRKNNKEIVANPASLPEVSAVAAEKPVDSKPENGKFELKRSEARSNLVPINLEDEIRQRAYELYEQRGYSSGHETDDWLSAEREVVQRYRQQSA